MVPVQQKRLATRIIIIIIMLLLFDRKTVLEFFGTKKVKMEWKSACSVKKFHSWPTVKKKSNDLIKIRNDNNQHKVIDCEYYDSII